MAVDNITLDNVGVELEPEFAPTLLKNAFEGSAIGQVTDSEPMPLAGLTVPVYNGGIEVGLVGEAEAKPQSKADFGTQSIATQKVATIVVVSKEVAMANPVQLLQHVERDMTQAISRAVDHLVLRNQDAKGTSYSGANKSVLHSGTEAVELSPGYSLDEYAEALLAAYDLAGVDHDPNAWLFDTKQRARNTRVVQDVQQGLPDLRGGASVVAGLPAVYNKAVSGRSNVLTDHDGTLAIVGDFNQVRWGFVERLDIVRSTEATVGGVSMFETNQVALLVEAILGWTVLDQGAFAVIRVGEEAGSGD